MKIKLRRMILMASLALFSLAACNNQGQDGESVSIEGKEQEEEQKREEEDQPVGGEKKDKGKPDIIQQSPADQELIADLLAYPQVTSSNATALVRTFVVKDQKEEIRDQKIQAYTNYTASGDIDSQELFIQMGEEVHWRVLYRDGVEYAEKNSSGQWEAEDKEVPEAYISYYTILENLKSLEKKLTVKEDGDRYVLEFISHDREDFEAIKGDFNIDFPEEVKLTVMGQYIFNKDQELEEVIQEIGTTTVNISVKSKFEEYNYPYPVMKPEVEEDE